MNGLSVIDMLLLDKIGERYRCPLYLPPLKNRLNPFFDITKIEKNLSKSEIFLNTLDEIGMKKKYCRVGGKKIIEIIGAK